MFVYAITNTKNNNKYIGITTGSVQKRWNEHCCSARHDMNRPLYRAIRKYGEDAFCIEVLDTAKDKKELKQKECAFISKLKTFARDGDGYNLTLGGDGLEKLNSPKGENNSRAVLSDKIVEFIRNAELSTVSNSLMAGLVHKEFGTLFLLETLKSARNGKTWKHVCVAPIKTKKGSRKPQRTEEQKVKNRQQLSSIHALAIQKSADMRRGKRQANAKLSVGEVILIFYAEESGIKIAERFSVHKKIVYGIKNRTMHTYLTRSL